MKNDNRAIKEYFDNINFLTKELAHQKDDNLYLYQKLSKIQQSFPWKCYKITKTMFKYPIKTIMHLLPIRIRKKITKFLSKIIIFNQRNQISYVLKQEWKKHLKKQPKEIKHDVLVFSIISWNFRFQRPQQLSTELSKLGHRVFYIEHEFIPQHLNRSGYQAIETEKINTNLYKIKISSSAKHFIYNDTCTPKDTKIMFASIKTLIKEARILNPVAIVEHPFWTNLAKVLAMPTIYDCMDNHSGFS
jgi:hypothetical protein